MISFFLASQGILWGPHRENITRAMREQKRLGAEIMWSGFFTKIWGDIQEEDYRQLKEKQVLTGERWMKIIIREIF